ncbi:unnamed protein product, partial [marine sediment metagenome]
NARHPNNWATVTSKDWSLNVGGDEKDTPELFNLKDDPEQVKNVYEENKNIGLEMGKGFIDFLKSVGTDPKKVELIEGKMK